MPPAVRITTAFEGGNVHVVDACDPASVLLELRPDTNAEIIQAFAFRAESVRGRELGFRVLNASAAIFPGAWEGYSVYASYDDEEWFSVATRYDGSSLDFRLVAERDDVHFAYTPAYSTGRRQQLHRRVARTCGCRFETIGTSLEGRDLGRMTLGNGPRTLVVTARQHPGQAMAEWFVEGLVGRLLDEHDRVAGAIQEACTVHLIGCMNPDGVAHGNLRVNAAGADLNRAWLDPSASRTPEVLHARRAIERSGCDAFLDVHGDERIPHGFVKGCEGNPKFTPRLLYLERMFQRALILAAPREMQGEHGYPRDEPSTEMLRMGANWVCQAYDCLSMTIEMPFKTKTTGRTR